MWQDIVILAGSIVAIASLFPTLLDENASVPLTTSVPTLVVLSGQGVAFYSLDLLGSALGAGAGFVVWSLIAYYKAPEETSTPSFQSLRSELFGSESPESESVSETGSHPAPDASSRTTPAPHAD